jgi:hypothetical protein
MTEKKRTGRPPTGWVKVSVKLSPEAAALLAEVHAGRKSATVDEALRVYTAMTLEEICEVLERDCNQGEGDE